MSFYLRKRLRLAPLVRLNLGLRQASVTLGKGVRVNVSPKGVTPGATIGGGFGYRGRTRRWQKKPATPAAAPSASPAVDDPWEAWTFSLVKGWFRWSLRLALVAFPAAAVTYYAGSPDASQLFSQVGKGALASNLLLAILWGIFFNLLWVVRNPRRFAWGLVLTVVFPAILIGIGLAHDSGWIERTLELWTVVPG